MRLLIWMNMPSHYQSAFFDALRRAGTDLRVAYYASVPQSRLALGWADPGQLPQGEEYAPASLASLHAMPDWRERVHIVPGYGSRFTRQLALALSRAGARWVHWSEASRGGLRWYRSFPLKRWYASLVNRYAMGALAQGSMAESDFVRWGVRPDNIAHLSYSVAPPTTVTSDPLCAEFCGGGPAFVFAGSLSHRKATDVALKAFALASGGTGNWRLVLVGPDAPGAKYQRLAASLGISDRVLFRGTVPSPQVAACLQGCSVLLLPSRFDGWGVALNEGASAGLALIGSSAAGASHHLIDAGVNGFRVRPGDVSSLASAMRRYVDNPPLAQAHGQRSREIVQRYTPDATALRLLQILRSWEART